MPSVVAPFFFSGNSQVSLIWRSETGVVPIWYSPGGASRFHAPSAPFLSLSLFIPLSFPEPSDPLQWPPPPIPCLAWAPRCQLQGRKTFTGRVGPGLGSLPGPLRTCHTRTGQKIRKGFLLVFSFFFFLAWYHFSADRLDGELPRAARRTNQEHPVD